MVDLKDITVKNIKDYFVGNFEFFKEKLGLQPEYIREQVMFRASQCPKECIISNKCHYCGCDRVPKLFLDYSCNKNKALPNLMGEEEWKNYKTKLKIERNENNKLP